MSFSMLMLILKYNFESWYFQKKFKITNHCAVHDDKLVSFLVALQLSPHTHKNAYSVWSFSRSIFVCSILFRTLTRFFLLFRSFLFLFWLSRSHPDSNVYVYCARFFLFFNTKFYSMQTHKCVVCFMKFFLCSATV